MPKSSRQAPYRLQAHTLHPRQSPQSGVEGHGVGFRVYRVQARVSMNLRPIYRRQSIAILAMMRTPQKGTLNFKGNLQP